jgi:hypothetical protein
MILVKISREIVREQIKNGGISASDKYKGAIRPIYGLYDDRRLDLIGSCVLVNIGKKSYLITAAHVIDERQYASLYLGGKGLIPLGGEFTSTAKPSGDRTSDHYDFSWLELSANQLQALEEIDFISESDLATNKIPPKRRTYVIMGYPCIKNGKDTICKNKIVPKFMKYTSTGKQMPALLKKLGITGQDHIIISHKKRSTDNEGNITESIHPRGMSGGAIIDLGSLVTPKELLKTVVDSGKLAGIFIEKQRDFSAMVSVRIEVIVETIRNYEVSTT